MRPGLLDLLEQDIYTDAPEFADRVQEVKKILGELRESLADADLIREARELYQTDDVEIDDLGVETSRADDGTWVQGWVWVQDSDLGPDGKPRGEP